MEKIIDPVSVELLKAELTPDKKLMDTNKGHNEIYIVNWHDSPNVVTEIGRLREISFREAGGSTGLALDLDEFDKMEKPYQQIVVWDPDNEAILGGYRYILGPDVTFYEDGQPKLATAHQFRFSETFIREYLPHTVELGRSFVCPEYQSSKNGAKSIFALDNLWDGITAVVYQHTNIIYFFGKMTMYPSFDRPARDLILHFLWKHYGDKNHLVTPVNEIKPESDVAMMDIILHEEGLKEDYRLLKEAVRRRNTNIPPLVNSYMMSSPSMLMFGTSPNDLMSNVEETGILVCFNELYDDKKDRHIDAFKRYKLEKIRSRFPFMDPEMETKFAERWEGKKKNIYSKLKQKLSAIHEKNNK